MSVSEVLLWSISYVRNICSTTHHEYQLHWFDIYPVLFIVDNITGYHSRVKQNWGFYATMVSGFSIKLPSRPAAEHFICTTGIGTPTMSPIEEDKGLIHEDKMRNKST